MHEIQSERNISKNYENIQEMKTNYKKSFFSGHMKHSIQMDK